MEVLSNGLPAKLLLLLLTVVMSTNMSSCRGTADAADTGQPPPTSDADYVATDDITIEGVEGTFPFHLSDLEKEFSTKPAATHKYQLFYGDKEWGECNVKSDTDDTTIYMRIIPSKKSISIHGINIDNKTKLSELEPVLGKSKVVEYPDWIDDDNQNVIEYKDSDTNITIFFKKDDSIEFLVIRTIIEERN